MEKSTEDTIENDIIFRSHNIINNIFSLISISHSIFLLTSKMDQKQQQKYLEELCDFSKKYFLEQYKNSNIPKDLQEKFFEESKKKYLEAINFNIDVFKNES
jgi:hypothetical protein